MVFSTSLGPLRHRNFALIWTAALVSNVGSWMQTVSLGVLVTARTHQPLWTGLVAAAAFVPVGLMSPIGGAMADRYDRRRWLLATTAGETVFASGLAILAGTGHATPWAAVILAFLGGTCSAIGFPAYQAMLPDLVDRGELLAAVSLSSAQYNMGRVVGPALAGVVLVLGSYELAFALNAVSFLAVIVALLLVRLPVATGSGALDLWKRIAEGARSTYRIPGARSAVVLISLVALLASPFIALVPAMAFTVLGAKAGGTAVLVTAQGMGAVAGAVLVAPIAHRIGRYRIVVISLVSVPVTLILYGLAPNLWLSAAGIFLVGFAYIGVLSGLNTVVQMSVPNELRGRALGFYMMALGTIYPVGAVVQGAIGNRAGVRWVTIGGAALLFLVIELIATFRRPMIEALRAVDAPAPPVVDAPAPPAVDAPAHPDLSSGDSSAPRG